MLIRVEAHPYGPRLFVLGCRVHHWHWGCGLIALGGWLVAVDRPDIHLGGR